MYGLPNMLSTFEALNLEAENGDQDLWLPLRDHPMYIRVAMVGRGQPTLVQVGLRPNRITAGQIEEVMCRSLPQLGEGVRVTMVRRDGIILRQQEVISVQNEQILWAVINEPHGTNVELPDISTTVREVLPLLKASLKGNQLKLLLRGEQGLHARVHRARFDQAKQRGIVLDAAMRYGMRIQEQHDFHVGGQAVKQSKEEWQEVHAKQKKTTLGSATPAATAAKQVKSKAAEPEKTTGVQKQYLLKKCQWDQPVMEKFKVDTSGVFLVPHQDQAERLSRQLLGTTQAVALVTIQALKNAPHVEKVTIEVEEHDPAKGVRDKVVTAFINSYGPKRVTYSGRIGEVTRKSMPTTTTVLRARTQADKITKEQWRQCSRLVTPADLKKQLKEWRPDLHIEDAFRMEQGGKELSFLVRVFSAEVDQWLRAEQLPFSFTPTGEALQGYKVVWDRELDSLGSVICWTGNGIARRSQIRRSQVSSCEAESWPPHGHCLYDLRIAPRKL